jgi:hypothetical protein
MSATNFKNCKYTIAFIKEQNITGFIRMQRVSWLGHAERKADDDNVKKIKRWKPMSKRSTGRPKTRWEDD